MAYRKHVIPILVLWIYQLLYSVQTQQLPSSSTSVDPSSTYYKTFMLCTQTPTVYRTKGCFTDQNCKVPRLTKCIGGICCARDVVALDALSMMDAMFPGTVPKAQETVNTFVERKPIHSVPKVNKISKTDSIHRENSINDRSKLKSTPDKIGGTKKSSHTGFQAQPQGPQISPKFAVISSVRPENVKDVQPSPSKQSLSSLLSGKQNQLSDVTRPEPRIKELTSANTSPATPVPQSTSAASCEDVSIIGAGIAGTYAAWRLRNIGLKIGIYEYTDRVGGRLFTYHFREAPDINVELGAMRFLPNTHKRIDKAARDLRLPVEDFKEGLGKKDRTLYYLREVHLRDEDLGGIHTPYNLRPAEMKSPEKLRWYLSSTYTNFTGDFSNINQDLFTIFTADGVSLYQQSHAEAFAKMASQEAMRYLRDHLGFHSEYGSATAVIDIPAAQPTEPNAPEPVVKTISTGMDSFPRTFQHEFLSTSDLHSVHRNQKLFSIKERKGGGYNLSFRKTVTSNGETKEIPKSNINVCSNKVILALPKVSLQSIDWEPLQKKHMKANLDAVTDVPVVSIFLLYDYPWWRNVDLNFTHIKTDLPNRQIYDFGVSRNTGKAVLMVCYLDGDEVDYWRKLQSHGRKLGWRSDVHAVTDHVVTHAHIHLSYIYNISMFEIPPARDGTIMLWDNYPFNGAWGIWKPGFKWMNVRREITKPSENDDVYISPGYYGTYANNYWAEGALEGMDEVLKHFGLPPYS